MLFRQMLREHLFLVLGYQLLLLVNIAAAIAYWPELRENIEAISAVMKLIPSETLRDMVFMLEHFCGHGFNADDPRAPCYRGPNSELWFDLTCTHPNAAGHAEIAKLFEATVTE